jgi:hypothetical protein
MLRGSIDGSPASSGAGGARTISDADLLDDLRRVGKQIGRRAISQSAYSDLGRFGFVTYCRRFGSWKAALALVHLEPAHLMNISQAELIADMRRVAGDLKTDRLRANDYFDRGKYSRKIVHRLFGRWQTAAEAAGLQPVIARPLNNSELFENLKHVRAKLGRNPTYEELKPPLSKFGVTAYTNRFGTFRKAMQAFAGESPPPEIPPVVFRHTTTRTINHRLRFLVLRRDHFRCRACGKSPATDLNVQLQVDHIKPWTAGGETTLENLQTLCQICNSGKADLPWCAPRLDDL